MYKYYDILLSFSIVNSLEIVQGCLNLLDHFAFYKNYLL